MLNAKLKCGYLFFPPLLSEEWSEKKKRGKKKECVGESHQQGHTYNREIRCYVLIGVYSTQGYHASSLVISFSIMNREKSENH